MSVLDPPEDWTAGAITAEMMNTRIRDKIRQLQVGLPRGVLQTYVTTATVINSTSSSEATTITQWQGSFTVDSPRNLQANVVAAIALAFNSTSPGIMVVKVSFNGVASINTQMRLEALAGSGLLIPNMTGSAVPVPAGTVTVTATLARSSGVGSGDGQMNTNATLQVLDVGGS